MRDALLDKVRERIAGYVDDAICRTETNLEPTVSRIMADVETALVLGRREGMECGMLWPAGTVAERAGRPTPAQRFPLPTRTHRVLNETADPHGLPIVYAYFGGNDRQILARGESDTAWRSITNVVPLGGVILPTAERIDVWAALKAEPYRTEQVPGDENNPWGEP